MVSSLSESPSITSSLNTNKKKWRDMGWSGSANQISGLVESARRKSTDSLRSLTSQGSRKSRTKRGKEPAVKQTNGSASIDKELPSAPQQDAQDDTPRQSLSGSISSQVIHETAEDPPLEIYEMPPATPGEQTNVKSTLPQANGHAANTFSDAQNADKNASTPTNNTVALPPITTTTNALSGHLPSQSQNSQRNASNGIPSTSVDSLAKPQVNGWTSEQEQAAGLNASTDSQTSLSATAASARSLAEPGLSKVRRKSVTDSATQGNSTTDSGFMPSRGSSLATSALPVQQQSQASPLPSTQWASDKVGGGDGNTIAQLYAVFGLPKDPSVWTLAEEDCVAGVHHLEGAISRFWRPEVLGCSICPGPSESKGQSRDVSVDEDDAGHGSSRHNSSDKKSQSPKFIEMSDGRGGIEKTETARVLSKALKLSFTREVEIVAEQGHYPPKASLHSFSFSVPTVSGTSDDRDNTRKAAAMATGVSVGARAANGVGEGYGLTPQRNTNAGNVDAQRLATFYGVVLTVWSAADEKRAKVIRKELARAVKHRSNSTSKANASKSSTGPFEDGQRGDDGVAAADTKSTYFMPYAICIVSRFPLYSLLGDWNKMAWHKYSRNIEMHNQLMSTILRHPAPRLGEEISVGSPDKDISFHCTFPGAVEWGTGLTGVDFTMWPLFKSLSLEKILTICEIALGRNGRVLFISRFPALLGMAVESVRYMVEQCGWRGVAHQNCHARDVRIYVEDPGSWIIGINTELRSLAAFAKEVCVVDLDINHVECANPPPGAVSTKSQRDRRIRRLMQSIFINASECAPPREFVEAYPGGRFRPLSRIVTRDLNSAYEQLPQPAWWNQTSVLQAFDVVLHEGSKPSLLKKVLRTRRGNKNVAAASETEIAAITALRKRASTFVDARDGLENKIGRLNKRLAFLISESEMWRAQFAKIQTLVDRLTKEANELRSKVDKERRESKRLSSRLAQRDIEHVQLQLQLKETEGAREEAIAELIRMKDAIESVEQEREAMMEEIRAVVSGGGNIDEVNLSVSRLDLPHFANPLSRSTSPTGSQASMTPSQAADYILKSRAMAEARISEGRPGRVLSRTTSRNGSQSGHVRSMSQDRAERDRKMSTSGSQMSHGGNHFTDEQMNYEIQQRTSIVTDQISRIQQQLESTLTNLEGRRSGTYERENERRRQRRGSNASVASSRFDYRSSVGHGGAESVNDYASEDGRSDVMDYEAVERVNNRGQRSARRRKERVSAHPPPTASSQSLRDAYASSNASHNSLFLPQVQPKSQARRLSATKSQPAGAVLSPTDPGNDWKQHVNESGEKKSNTPSLQSPTTPTPEVIDTDEMNGVVVQPPLISVVKSVNKDSQQAHPATQEPSPHEDPQEVSGSGDTSPTLAMPHTGPENEILLSQSGWTVDRK